MHVNDRRNWVRNARWAAIISILLTGTLNVTANGPIIIDHTAVDKYNRIPDRWMAAAKTMLLNYPGESHGSGLPYGLELLQQQDSRFAVSIRWSGGPEDPTDTHLRVFRTIFEDPWWLASGGEEDTWTHSAAVERVNNHLAHCESALGNPIDAFAWAWCWDMVGESGGCDDAGWAGRIYTDFEKTEYTDYWDIATTAPCLNDYLIAWEGYEAGHPNTAVMYTTGPLDAATGCPGFQRWRKNNAIRAWVTVDNHRCLFDYADILSHNDAGEAYTVTWQGHEYPFIHPDNAGEYDGGEGGCHIGENGCLRLGKAGWVMLARIAGWDGGPLDDCSWEHRVESLGLAPTEATRRIPYNERYWVSDLDGDADADSGDVRELQRILGTRVP